MYLNKIVRPFNYGTYIANTGMQFYVPTFCLTALSGSRRCSTECYKGW